MMEERNNKMAEGCSISDEIIEQYRRKLTEDEKSKVTVEKYMHDIYSFQYFMQGQNVTKEKVIYYKEQLMEHYTIATVNSILAALNGFFKYMNRYEWVVKALKLQRDSFRSSEKDLTKEEYYRLLTAARKRGNDRLYLLMQTICATGIRVSELKFITVEALEVGHARVTLKGKSRTVILPNALRRMLQRYAKDKKIVKGSIFITRTGKPLDRSNICHEMKALSKETQVNREKLFPHNLRHLFACTYYAEKKDLTHLADLLGHSSINTTRIYTLVSGAEQARQIETLGLVL